MNKNSTVYVDSTTTGKSWAITTGKDRKGYVRAIATEGTLKHGGVCVFTSFSFVMFQARTADFTSATAKRLTDKTAKEVVDQLIVHLFDTGLSLGTVVNL